ncbi:MAG: N-6 DNA methylase [Planctomycetes bacterium]|nr:N-6 DNA methylase [Planctomycetota bacterium]
MLYAEARDPRLIDHRLYQDSYSISGLLEEILGQGSQGWADNRAAYWKRLCALFRVFDEGLTESTHWQHIPARGGDFFSSQTPEGRLLSAARLSDRLVARVLLQLATTSPKAGVGYERVSFRELDIESLGAVYEGLLEFEPRVAAEPLFEIRLQGRPLLLPVAEVGRLCEARGLTLSGLDLTGTDLARFVSSDEKEKEEDAEETEDEEEPSRGGVARVVRLLAPGSFFFMPGAGRKGSGSFYTPPALVKDLVRHTLGPLVEGKRPAEIEALRILDPACGSAHFLVEAMRFLGQALHRAYVEKSHGEAPAEFRSTTGPAWDADWKASDRDARAANSEARAWCKRRIAERCLFGVDLNPTAVMLARVALWIESLAGDRPLSFFDHHVRCGNALLGTWLDRLHHPPLKSMERESDAEQMDLFANPVIEKVREAAETRSLIAIAPGGEIEPDSLEERRHKERLRAKAEETLRAARLLFDLRSSSAFVPEIWGEWQVLCDASASVERLERHVESRPWSPAFRRARQEERFFHWELEFPEVLLDERTPGFSAILGNPPWDKVLPSKHEFYADLDVLIRAFKGNDLERRIEELHRAKPGLREEFVRYQERTKAAARVLRESGDFPHSESRSGAAHEDVSKYFVDRAARLAADRGIVGLVVPSVLYNGDGCVGIRRMLIEEAAVLRFYGFENKRKIFPIHSSYKFVSLVFQEAVESKSFDAAFMRHDLAELEMGGSKPWMVRMKREEIARLSPETLAFLEYRSASDQQIIRKMYEGRPTLQSEGPGAWGAKLISWRLHDCVFNASEDKDLWTDPKTKRLYTPESVLGKPPKETGELIRKMREKGFWPVFEGKHVDQFVVGIKPVRWWLNVAQAEAKYAKPPRNEPTLVFRETASNTNERTCIAAILPAGTATSHKLSGMRLKHVDQVGASVVLNSLSFDYALRMRTAGVSVSFTYMHPMPVPAAAATNRLPKIPTQLAWESKNEHISQDRDAWPLLWKSNRAVAEAYGLDADDFAHILDTFPGFKKKRPELHGYFIDQLAKWR